MFLLKTLLKNKEMNEWKKDYPISELFSHSKINIGNTYQYSLRQSISTLKRSEESKCLDTKELVVKGMNTEETPSMLEHKGNGRLHEC